MSWPQQILCGLMLQQSFDYGKIAMADATAVPFFWHGTASEKKYRGRYLIRRRRTDSLRRGKREHRALWGDGSWRDDSSWNGGKGEIFVIRHRDAM